MKGQISFLDEIIVDNFAGGGGASTGIELALGRPVDIAINHSQAAIAMHKANHPFTEHFCESVWDVDPKELCRGRKVALMWLSPDCKHFSKAKGGKPVEKNIRGLAWIAIRWASLSQELKPRIIILENVEEFKTWGRLGSDGRPDEKHKGETFRSFVNALKRNGYTVDWRELKACDYGAPTSRKRLVLIARSDGNPIVFPAPTHAPTNKAKKLGLLPYKTAADIIDWTLPCPSVFERKKPLVPATMRRIARGLDKFVIKNEKPFIIQTQFNNEAQAADKPLSTVEGVNKHSVVLPTLTKFNDDSAGQAVNQPLATVMAGATRFGKVDIKLAPYIQHENFNNVPQAADKPLSTLTTGNHQYLTTAKLTPYAVNVSQTESENRQRSVEEPLRTQCVKAEECVCTPKLVPFIEQGFGGNYNGAGSCIEKPLPTVTAVDHNGLIAPTLIQYHSETSDNEVRAYTPGKPLGTVDGSNRHGISAAFMSQYFTGGGSPQACSTLKPLRTITANDKNNVVTVKLTEAAKSVNDLKYWDKIREMLNEYAGYELAEDEILLFKIDGVYYFISDIGMRMLIPRELYRAQGFPEDYKIKFDYNGKQYSKKEQVARCGNAVCPPLAEAVVRANLPELASKKRIYTMRELEKQIAAA